MSSREVFTLRKAGRIAEALAMARRDYAAHPGDPWNVKALAWSLHSAVRTEADNGVKIAMAREFMELPLAADDELLQNVRAGMRRMAEPFTAELQAAREMALAGGREQALARLRNIATAYPGEETVEVAMAWELCRDIQQGVKEAQPDGARMWGRVEEYMRLDRVPKPSGIHSLFLQWVAVLAKKGAAPRFCEFLRWWDPGRNLREEDAQGREKEDGGRYDSVVETAIAGVGKTIEKCTDEGARQTAAGFVEQYAGRFPTQVWFPYYRAICKLATGLEDEARTLLISIVRAKITESWAWHKLAACFARGSREQLQCLCRAAICPVGGDQYLLGVYAELGALLLEGGHAAEGRYLLEKACAIRMAKGWRISAPLQVAMEESEDVVAVDAAPILKKWGMQADEVLLGDLPWRKAVLSSANVMIEREGQKRVFHFLKMGPDAEAGEMRDCRVPANKTFRFLEELPLGAPVAVRVDLSGHHPRVLSIKSRLEGEPWDVCPQTTGTVRQINAEKMLAVVASTAGVVGLVYFDSCPEARTWSVGEAVKYRWHERNGKIRIVAAKAVQELAPCCQA